MFGENFDSLHVRLFGAGALTITPDSWRARDVLDSFWRFYFHDCAGASLELPDGIVELAANQAYFVPAKVPFSCRADNEVGHFYVHFDCVGVSEALRRALFERPLAVPHSRELERETRIVADQIRAAKNAKMSHALACRLKALIYKALALSMESLSPEQKQRASELEAAYTPLLPALHFIEANLGEKLTIEILAQQCHFSDDYFIRRFRESLGQSPISWIQEKRVAWAAQQLLFSSASIEEIAPRAGFGNRTYFSRVFTRITGVSPSAYRQSARP